MEVAEASAMDFHALSRRELQALCKRNGVRANMTNAAMSEALQALASVDGIDEIGTTLCLPTPGRSVMKSGAKVAGEEQQQGSPLPRGRRVSVKLPEAIRMDVEESLDDVKRDLVKEIVRTPGVALRSTSRRSRATPTPLPTPAPASSVRAATRRTAARKMEEVAPTPATLRRSQRTAGRKAAAEPMETDQHAEDVFSARRTTRRSAKSKVMMALDQEEEVEAAASKEEKVQLEKPKDVTSDVKCDDPEEEVTKLLEGDNKAEELEEGDEADSSDATIGSAVVSDKSCDDPKVEEVAVVVVEEATKTQEGIVEEQEPISVEKSAPLAAMEDSPILGVLSKAEAIESFIEKVQDASVDDGEVSAEWSPVREMTDETSPVLEDKEVAAKEDGFTVTGEADHSPKVILPAAAAEAETSEEDDLCEEKEGAAAEKPQAELTDDEISEEDELDEEKEGAAIENLQTELIDDETSEEDDLDEDEECASDDDETAEEIDSTEESDDETNEESDSEASTDLNGEELVQMLQETAIAEEANEDGSAEDDDFTGDLPPEFDNVVVLSDAETDSDIASPVLEENQPAAASATKTAVKSLDDSSISEEHEVSNEEVSEEANATVEAMREAIVESLDKFTINEATKSMEETLNIESQAVGANEMQKKKKKLTREDLNSMSRRKLESMYKKSLIAAKEGKRLPLAELVENASVDC